MARRRAHLCRSPGINRYSLGWAEPCFRYRTRAAQSTAHHHQFVRQHGVRLAGLCRLLALPPADKASFIVRQTLIRSVTGRLAVSWTRETVAMYSARGPP